MREQLAKLLLKSTMAALALVSATICMAQNAAREQDLIGTSWLVEDIGGGGVVDKARSTLEFVESGRVAGLGACNRYMGPVSFDDDGVSFGNLAATLMACPEALMNQEQRYFQALAKVDRMEISNQGQILVAYSDGDPVLRFSRIIEK